MVKAKRFGGSGGTILAKRVTVKDIAQLAGVSLGTVHCALAGKSGVGEKTRKRILEIARKNQYRPNAVAASLKRKAVNIVAGFPQATDDNRFYFSPVWKGVKDYLHSVSDLNVTLLEMPYHKGGGQEDAMGVLLDGGRVDGILTVGFMDDFGETSLTRFNRLGIPVVIVGDDIPHSGRICCVRPNYQMIGRTLAELFSRQMPAGGSVLMCAGQASMPSHYLIVMGFDSYMQDNGLDYPVYKIHTETFGDDCLRRIVRELERHDDIAACLSVNARGSVMLGQALVESGRGGTMPAVGSDVFEENIAFLREGVFTNLLHKNPYYQANLAAKILVDYILRDIAPPGDVVFVGNEVVFRSALPMFDAGLSTPPAFWAV